MQAGRFCTAEGCSRKAYICSGCVGRWHGKQIVCIVCWRASGRLCIVCGATPARKESRFNHNCKECFANADIEVQRQLVAEESAAYLEARRKLRQTWDGSEPAWQCLILPRASSCPLPQYAPHHEFLHPEHCRLCFATRPTDWTAAATTLPASVDIGVSDWLSQHVREAHSLSAQEYRSQMLARAVAEWPQPITPQVLRSRAYAYKKALCDASYSLSVCACCTREKRRCKLQLVELPGPDAASAPSWLGINAQAWALHGASWYGQMDNLLNVEKVF